MPTSPPPSRPSNPAEERFADSESPATGARVAGRYVLLRPLGTGGMGAVHLAEDQWRGDRLVALKSAPLADTAGRESLEREFEWSCRLRHPNVVAVHDFGRCAATRRAFFTMDHAEGRPFLETLAQVDERCRAEAVVQLCRALDFVHSRSLVHCDLKSENVLVRRGREGGRPHVVLVDFGLAAEPDELAGRALGRFSGTLSHAAPELVGGPGRPGPGVDLYALGVLLFELHSGRRLFDRPDLVSLAEAHRGEPPPDLTEACPSLPAAVRSVLSRLLAKDPAERPQSALVVAQAYAAADRELEVESLDSLLSWVRAPRMIAQEAVLGAALGLAAVAADRGAAGARSALVLGAPGSGKTRLLEEAARRAQLSGVRVLIGRPDASDEPYAGLAAPLVEAVRAAGEAAGPLLPELVKLAPELGAELGVAPSAPLSFEDEALRLAAATWDVLIAAAVRPLLLVLDGVESLSTEATELVVYLLRRLRLEREQGRRPPISLLAAARHEVSPGLVQAFQIGGACSRTKALDGPGVASLLESLFPGLEDLGSLAELLHRSLGGNAALAERWLGSLVRRGALTRRVGGWSVELDHEALSHPPRDLGEAVLATVEVLDGLRRDLLIDVSLLPAGVDADLLASLAGRSLGEQEAGLDALERADLVLVTSSAEGRRVSVDSALVREASSRAWPERCRERAALLLQAALREDALGHVGRAELAESAGDTAEASRQWRAALDAAREHEDHLRTVTAGRRLAALVEGGDRAAALRAVGRALLSTGRLDEAESVAGQAEGASPPGEEGRRVQLGLSRDIALARGHYGRAEDLARELLELIPPGEDERWQAALQLSRILARIEDADWTELLPELQAAALTETRQVDLALLTGTALISRSRHAEAAEALRAALPASRANDRQLATAANNLGVAELRRGSHRAAASALREAVEVRRRTGARIAMSGTLINLGLLDLERSRPALAARRLREALEVKREAGDTVGLLLALANLALAELQRHDFTGLFETLELAGRELEGVEDTRAYRVLRVLALEGWRLVGDAEAERREMEVIEEFVDDPGFAVHLPTVRLARARRLASEGKRDEALESMRALARDDEASVPDRVEAAVQLSLLLSDAACARRRPLEPVRSSSELGEEALALVSVARSALGEGREWPSLRFTACLAAAGALDILGRPETVGEELETAAGLLKRVPERLDVAEYHAALGLAAARKQDWEGAEVAYLDALRRVRAVTRRVPRRLRPSFLEDPRRRGLREALLAVRGRLREEQEAAGFFAPLTVGTRVAAADPGSLERKTGKQRGEARRLREVIEITRDINALMPVGALLDRVLDRVLSLMQAERGFIVLRTEEGGLEFAAARDSAARSVPSAEFAVSRSVLDEVVRTARPVLSSDARADSRFVSKQSVLLLDLRSVLVAPLVAREQVIGALYVDNSQRAGAFGEAERDLLALFAGQAAVAVENARLHETRVAKDLLDQELSIARGIQERLLPERLPLLEGFRVAASMTPARELGGDYYDALVLPDGRVRLAIGDVSGKGIPAGLVMVMAHSILRSVGFSDEPLDRILERANAALEGRIEDDKFMTLALLEPGPGGRTLKLALAGHEPPLLWRRSTGVVEVLEAGGLALGMLPELAGRLREDRLELEPGDVLCFYTDGVTECRGPDGSMFGRERLERALGRAAEAGAEGVLEVVGRELDRFRGEAERSDDVTLLVLEAERSDDVTLLVLEAGEHEEGEKP